MSAPKLREHLEHQDELSKKDLARLRFRVAQKVKSSLSELDDINYLLNSIPQKNAKRAINDEMVVAVFKLSEFLVKTLGFCPIRQAEFLEHRYVHRGEEVSSKNGRIQVLTTLEPPTATDEARYLLLKEHIKVLQQFVDPEIRGQDSLSPACKLPSSNKATSDGWHLYRKWVKLE